MYNGYKVVVATPAGRQRFLEILLRHSLCNRDVIDRHDLWLNTTVPSDIDFIHRAARAYPDYFNIVHPIEPLANRPVESIAQFYRNCIDEDTIYIKLDDDVCYICPDALRHLVEFRVAHPEAFLIYPIVICTGMEWVLDVFRPVARWKRSFKNCNLEHIRRHVEFLSDPTADRYLCEPYLIPSDLSISINCISWMGKDFASFGGNVPAWPVYDEDWLTLTKTKEMGRPNYINGSSVMVHFSYTHGGTMKFLEDFTDLRQRYLELALEICPKLLPAQIKFFV